MTDRARVLIGRWMAAVAIGSAMAGIIWAVVLAGGFDLAWNEWIVHNGAAAIGFGLIAWLVIPTQPRNGAVWTSAWVGVFSGLYCLTLTASFQLASAHGMSIHAVYQASPADFAPLQALVPMMASWLYIPLFLVLTVGLLLFPDGRPPSPRWRWVTWAAIAAIALESLALMWLFRPSSTLRFGSVNSFTGAMALGPVFAITEMAQLVMLPVCIIGMIVRFRHSSGLERQQFRLVVWGAVTAGFLVLGAVLADFTSVGGGRLLLLAGIVVLIGSYGVAIAKYRLYDVDVVISRSLVYGALAVFIGVVYVGIVVGMGQLIGSSDRPNPLLAIGATGVVAIGFQPLRRRLQRLANRIVYGRRATPYEVLSTFSQRVAAVDPGVLTQIARALEEGTTADSVAIWMRRGGEMHLMAVWPDDADMPRKVGAGESPAADRTASVVQDGEELGVVTLRLSPGQPFSPTDADLVDQVAAGLGLALRNLKLTEDLRDRVSQLRDSRRRIVAVQDLTRRQLERDLHDGAQQRLVALKIKLGIGASMAAKEGLGDVGEVLGPLRRQADEVIDSVREFARGIYPPLLEAEGLGSALTARTRSLAIPVTVQAAGVERYPRDVEATVYFCVLEAVRNAVKHASAKSILITLQGEEDQLGFEVRDDGIGFDPEADRDGSGLINLSDRIDAMDGSLQIDSSPGHGTSIRGTLPIRQLATAT
jgi:signal transduction histidine kinase